MAGFGIVASMMGYHASISISECTDMHALHGSEFQEWARRFENEKSRKSRDKLVKGLKRRRKKDANVPRKRAKKNPDDEKDPDG